MILSSDNNDALNRAIAHENSSSSRIGLLENKMKKLEDVGVLIARILMPVLFITAGWGKISGYAGTQQYMEAMGVRDSCCRSPYCLSSAAVWRFCWGSSPAPLRFSPLVLRC